MDGLGAGDGRDVAITSDGRWAYMVNLGPGNVSGAPPASIVIFQRDPATGVLTQPVAPGGCISSNGDSQNGANRCQTLSTLGQPDGISLSSDDRFAYVTDLGSNAIHVLARDPATGALTEIQCLSDDPSPVAGCDAGGHSLGEVQALAISPDGTHAYAARYNSGISIFDRDPATGKLTQKTGTAGCVSDDGNDNNGAAVCADGRILNGVFALVVSPDGHTLYATGQNDNGVAVFHINSDGSVSQLTGTAGCATLTGTDQNGSKTCAVGRALEAPFGEAISPDGRFLYVAEMPDNGNQGGVAIFSIDSATGALTQLPGVAGCITTDGTSSGVAGACTVGGPTLANPWTVSISPDGLSAYVPSSSNASLTTLTLETGPVCQDLTVSTPYDTPIAINPSCIDRDGDFVVEDIVTDPAHGTLATSRIPLPSTYTPARGFSGTDTFTFDGSDFTTYPMLTTNTSPPATVTITVGAPPARLSHVHQSHRTWREGNRLAAITKKRPPIGTTFSFALNEDAQVTLTFAQRTPGRRSGKKCVAPTKGNRHKRKCTRTLPRAKIRFTGHAGTNRVAFDGRVNRRNKLRPGTYLLTITATAPTGASAPQHLRFTIVK